MYTFKYTYTRTHTQTHTGHDNFIYTLAVLPNGDIVSGGEDRTVRVWREGKCACCMRFPNTVWSVAVTTGGNSEKSSIE
jgi:phospholipase A-2-activating protein